MVFFKKIIALMNLIDLKIINCLIDGLGINKLNMTKLKAV